MDRKLASLALMAACLLASCGRTTTQVDASAPSTPTITASPTTTAPSPGDSPRDVADLSADFAPLEPGAYYVQPDDIPVRVVFEVPSDGWIAWIGTA